MQENQNYFPKTLLKNWNLILEAALADEVAEFVLVIRFAKLTEKSFKTLFGWFSNLRYKWMVGLQVPNFPSSKNL